MNQYCFMHHGTPVTWAILGGDVTEGTTNPRDYRLCDLCMEGWMARQLHKLDHLQFMPLDEHDQERLI